MFEQSILPPSRTHRTLGVALATAGQLALIGILLLIPMLYVQALPTTELTTMLTAPPPPPPPPPPPAPAPRVARTVRRPLDPSRLFEPRTIPTKIETIHDLPATPAVTGVAGIPGGVAGGKIGGVLGGILGSVPPRVPAPSPPVEPNAAPPKSATPDEIRVGGEVEAARLIRAPRPVYPLIAKEARIEGTVRLKAVIGKDGHIVHLTAVSGNALLVGAAMHAVEGWVYRPTYLNKSPVQVDTEIDVTFRLTS